MSGAYIEGYCYSEGGTGATAAIEANQTLATSTGTYVRPSSPQRFADQLVTWKTQLDAAIPAGAPWSCLYNSTTRRVTVSSTGLPWVPVLPGNVAVWIGWQLYGGTPTALTGTAAPAARVELLGVTVEPAEDWAQTELAQYRHGRSVVTTWGNHQVHKVSLHCDTAAAATFQIGYLQGGRVRIYQSSTATSAYAIGNEGGYIDGYVIACGPAVEQSENWWSWEMLLGVPR